MGLVGIPQLHDVEEWKSLTAAYILNYVSTADARFFGTTITVTDVVEVPAERRSLRQLQGSVSFVAITYSQEIVYKTIDAEKVNAEYIVTQPFAEANDRETYKNLLRRSGVEGLAGITSVTRVEVPTSLPQDEGEPSPLP